MDKFNCCDKGASGSIRLLNGYREFENIEQAQEFLDNLRDRMRSKVSMEHFDPGEEEAVYLEWPDTEHRSSAFVELEVRPLSGRCSLLVGTPGSLVSIPGNSIEESLQAAATFNKIHLENPEITGPEVFLIVARMAAMDNYNSAREYSKRALEALGLEEN